MLKLVLFFFVKLGLFLLALVSHRYLKSPVKRSWWHCLKKESVSFLIFSWKNALQQAVSVKLKRQAKEELK